MVKLSRILELLRNPSNLDTITKNYYTKTSSGALSKVIIKKVVLSRIVVNTSSQNTKNTSLIQTLS